MKKLIPALFVLVVLALIVTPVLLHFTQQGHNEIVIDWTTEVPEGAEPGYAFGLGTATLMQHELESMNRVQTKALVGCG